MNYNLLDEKRITALWAKSKPRHPLWKHLLDAAAVSLVLPNPLTVFGWSEEQTAMLVGLHDIGKADPTFQHQDPDISVELESETLFKRTCDPRCRHERLSARFIRDNLRNAGMSERDADTIGRAVVAHHGYWNESIRPVPSPYKEAQEEILQSMKEVLGINCVPNAIPENHSAFGMRLAGHVVLCDWIASNEKFFADSRLVGIETPSDYFATVQKVAIEWVDKLGLARDRQAGKAACIVETARPIQEVLLKSDIPPSLAIIEAPMGEGKTEAAWILAEKWRDKGYYGTYMALPTMATSDSLYGRYRDNYLKKLGYDGNAKLVHGMAWLRDDKEPEKPSEIGEPGDDQSLAAVWFRPTRRAMLAAHGVGTVDQAMLAGMNVKFGFLRLYGLADRVLVIDEVHAYDAYMIAIICRLLQWCACLKIPVILLSATLSAKQRATMIEAYGATGGDPGPDAPYPLITVAKMGEAAQTIEAAASSNRTLKIATHPGLLGNAAKTAAKAAKLVKDGGCCCVILNTVKQAQAVFKELKLPADQKLLFHARFTAADRECITNRVLAMFGKDTPKRPAKFVLVATQVVEQSLDVDFDYMISEIAPMDLLLQRSGRMYRHRKRASDPVLHVLLPKENTLTFGGTGYVYADKPLLRTMAILADQREVHLPNDFRILIERCYGSEEWQQSAIAWQAIKQADHTWDREAESLYYQGKQFALCEPSKRLFRPVNNDPTGDDSDDGNGWRAKTRLGANDRTAVLVEEEQLQCWEPGELPMKDVRALYRRSLKLPNYLPVFSPGPGYSAAVEAKGKLRGLLLLPLSCEGVWRGVNEKGYGYEVTYDEELGLMAGRLP